MIIMGIAYRVYEQLKNRSIAVYTINRIALRAFAYLNVTSKMAQGCRFYLNFASRFNTVGLPPST